MKHAAILCANGLGDGLLMMIASSQLNKHGYATTVYHEHYELLQDLFPHQLFKKYPPLDNFPHEFEAYKLLLVENDHSERAWKLFELREQKKLHNVRVIFPTPYPKKMTHDDFAFNSSIPFATNLSLCLQKLLNTASCSKENSIGICDLLTYRKYPTRVVIHPTSQDKKRNWHKHQFLYLATRLKNLGFCPYFAVGPNERHEWEYVVNKGFSLPHFTTIKNTLEFIYESGFLIGNDSGLGHLASNVKIPTLTISGNLKRVRLWRPDFHLNHIVTPSIPLPNFRGIGLEIRGNFWQYFISVNKVLKAFEYLMHLTEK